MLREPNLTELVAFVCRIQPELDTNSATELLRLDGVAEWIALRWHEERITASSLLGLHMERQETPA